jgi:hypothetical protein
MDERSYLVLRAVADACDAFLDDGAPTPAVSALVQRSVPDGRRSIRVVLRALHRNGYLRRVDIADDGPARWAPTSEGVEYLRERARR